MRQWWPWLATMMLVCVGAHAETRIPLVEGLVIVTAGHRPEADFEVVESVTAITPDTVEFTVEMATLEGKAINRLKRFSGKRIVRKADLRSSHRMIREMSSTDPELFPGTTFTQLSADVVRDLRSKGESAFILGTSKADTGAYDLMSAMLIGGRKYYRGPIKRVGPSTATTVLVNGKKTSLPTLHTRAQLHVGGDTVDTEAWWLDDPDNALWLRSPGAGKQEGSQVVRIDYPVSRARPAMAGLSLDAGLKGPACRAELHGVYFPTASAELLAVSAPTLKSVASLLKANPSWKVTVEGHTDNIGTAAYNLDLSKHRAASVRDALTGQYGIAASRIAVHGYGLTRPIETNTTLAGRARNRRVELARRCK